MMKREHLTRHARAWLRSAAGSLVLLSLAAQATEPTRAAAGEVAPDYEARVLGQDSRASLQSLRGKVVLLNTWATWCAPCLQELPAFERARARNRAAGLVVVSVNIDEGSSDDRVQQYVRALKLRFAVWRDPGNRFSSTFDVRGVPETLLIDRTGRIVERWSGPVDPTSSRISHLLVETLSAQASGRDR
jgi:cytochrome c-type biogenesis protein